jgi:hypothetical protein
LTAPDTSTTGALQRSRMAPATAGWGFEWHCSRNRRSQCGFEWHCSRKPTLAVRMMIMEGRNE